MRGRDMSAEPVVLDEHGHFWWRDEVIPEQQFAPEAHESGHLTIAQDGAARLVLDGSLHAGKHPFETIFSNHTNQRKVRPIQGITKESGKHILLIDAVSNGGVVHSNRFSYERYFSTVSLVGTDEPPRDKKVPLYSSFEVDLTGFAEWFGPSGLLIRRTGRTISASGKSNLRFEFDTPIGKVSVVRNVEHRESGSLWPSEVTLRERWALSVKPRKPVSSDVVRDTAHSLQDLIILLTDSHYSVGWPVVRLAGSRQMYTLYFRRSTSSASPPRRHELPTYFPRIQANFGELYSMWIQKREQFGAGFHNYVSTRRDVTLYVESRFFSLVSGLESFHRTKFADRSQSASVQAKVDRILKQIARSSDRRWVENALRLAGEPSLEQRLFDLISDLPFGLDHERVRAFAVACQKIRNDLAHYAGQRGREEGAGYVKKVHDYGEALAFLYHMVLLREIGVDEQSVRQILENSFSSPRFKTTLAVVGVLSKESVPNLAQPESGGPNLGEGL
jgi:hypothetical protein